MDAIKKKMQVMYAEKEAAHSRAEQLQENLQLQTVLNEQVALLTQSSSYSFIKQQTECCCSDRNERYNLYKNVIGIKCAK